VPGSLSDREIIALRALPVTLSELVPHRRKT
jgi:hypothetical protein